MSHGGIAPKTSTFQDAQGVSTSEGPSEPAANRTCGQAKKARAKEGAHLAGLFSRSASEEDGPGTWDLPRPSRRNEPAIRGAGDQSPDLTCVRGCTRVGSKNEHPPAGRPKARGTGAEDDGDRGSEGCVVVMTPGNG